jgi:membrane fusion protein (multidrug efflux system)
VNVTLTLEKRDGSVVIPEEALVGSRKGYHVFVVQDGKAVRKDVTVGLRKPGRVEIREGLSPGDRVVTHGHMQLEGGRRVTAKERPKRQNPGSE